MINLYTKLQVDHRIRLYNTPNHIPISLLFYLYMPPTFYKYTTKIFLIYFFVSQRTNIAQANNCFRKF